MAVEKQKMQKEIEANKEREEMEVSKSCCVASRSEIIFCATYYN